MQAHVLGIRQSPKKWRPDQRLVVLGIGFLGLARQRTGEHRPVRSGRRLKRSTDYETYRCTFLMLAPWLIREH